MKTETKMYWTQAEWAAAMAVGRIVLDSDGGDNEGATVNGIHGTVRNPSDDEADEYGQDAVVFLAD